MGDAALAAVLHRKPRDDGIPLVAWWDVAESLVHAVHVRRSVEGVATLSPERHAEHVREGCRAAERALSTFSQTERPDRSDPADRRLQQGLRSSVVELALLIVTPRPTSTTGLATAIDSYIAALRDTGPRDLSDPIITTNTEGDST